MLCPVLVITLVGKEKQTKFIIMGEIAEDMIDGACCALCGQYFEDPQDCGIVYEHGYPVACWDCYESDCGYQKAVADTL